MADDKQQTVEEEVEETFQAAEAEAEANLAKYKPAEIGDIVTHALKVAKAVVYGPASESGDGYVQHLLAQRQTAHMNGDEELADDITAELHDLGLE